MAQCGSKIHDIAQLGVWKIFSMAVEGNPKSNAFVGKNNDAKAKSFVRALEDRIVVKILPISILLQLPVTAI